MKKLIGIILCAAMIFAMTATAFGATALGTFTVLKTDDAGNPLKGAEFVLIAEGTTEPAYAKLSDENGSALFAGVADGTYTLKENTAPNGYIKSDDEYIIYVVNGVVISGYIGDATGNTIPVPYQTVTFVNAKAAPTPVTVNVPVVKTVEKTGFYNPGKETFSFEVYDFRYNGTVTVISNIIETDGTGTYYGDIVLEVETEDIVYEGFLIREIRGDKSGWTYSDTVYEAVPVFDANGGWTGTFEFETIENGDPVSYDEAVFVNSYYKKFVPAPPNPTPPAEETVEENPDTGAPAANLAVAGIALIAAAATVMKKRK